MVRTLSAVFALSIVAALILAGRGTGDWFAALAGPRGWLAGVALGVGIAWLCGVDWRSLPDRAWSRAVERRRDLGWSAVAAVSLAVLVAG